MPDHLPSRDPYKILQVDSEADPDVIQAAYRRLAQKHHPDRSADPASQARMAELNAAWELLRDPIRRARFDRTRFDGASPPGIRPVDARPSGGSAGSAGSSGPSGSTTSSGHPSSAPGPIDADRSTSLGHAARSAADAATVSKDWTSGRSTMGGGYDASMRRPDGEGAAGPPPGKASGSVLNFGRYAGWSLGEIARSDLDFLEWLDRMPIGRPYRDEIDGILRRAGRWRATEEGGERRGLFRRR